MRYEKKIIILGEVNGGFSRSEVKGTLTIERKERLRCMLSVFNLKDAASGEYLLGITCKDRRTEVKNLGRGGRISTMFEISPQNELDGSIRVVLAYANSQGATPVAFGSNDNKRVWAGNMLDGIIRPTEYFEPQQQDSPQPNSQQKNKEIFTHLNAADINIVDEKSFEKKNQKDDDEKASPFIDIIPADYQDGAVATKNFYPEGYGQSLREASWTLADAAPPLKRAPFANRRVDSMAAEAAVNILSSTSQLFTKQSSLSYYEQIRPQVEELFKKYPPATDINKLLPDTKWVRVDYDGNGKYFVIGLIGSEPSFVCYGVPAQYTASPPAELEGFCQWFPLDARKPEAQGYWLMYQDARTGESVEVEII